MRDLAGSGMNSGVTPVSAFPSHRRPRVLPVLFRVAALAYATVRAGAVHADTSTGGAAPLTFAHPIADLVYRRCSPCHREGQAAPFPLLTYADLRKHAGTIPEVLEKGLMPPWLPDAAAGTFEEERRLTETEAGWFRKWLAEGMPEGDPAKVPAPPRWESGWALGKPDLVATAERPYVLGPEGEDVYRNLVIRVPLPRDRWIRAVEFVPGNARVVHHAFIRVDTEGQARRVDGQDGQPGFDTMLSTVRMPTGQLLSWNPGASPIVSPPGLAWSLPANADLVVEMHLNRTGKPEPVQPSVGLYFTDTAPTNTCQLFKLTSWSLDFPADAASMVVRDEIELPVPVDVLAVYPHAHFLCRRMHGYAVYPDGRTETLLRIPRWDFNWQSAFRYATPRRLPRGTKLRLEYTYDNSTNNPANPNHPPKRVVYGPQSSDEMCELAFQVLVRDTNALPALIQTATEHRKGLAEAGYGSRIDRDPNDA
ncbi:MAG: hypothetical protein JNL97_01435, partial [Verrucomicrobiales bacterium]|nr:hypothetical protein [Verrucomicrobiales bacterium]